MSLPLVAACRDHSTTLKLLTPIKAEGRTQTVPTPTQNTHTPRRAHSPAEEVEFWDW